MSMKVHQENAEGLKRVFKVTLPQQAVADAEGRRLAEIGREARLPGFRPGRVPLVVLRQRFGATARAEAVENLVNESATKVLQDQKLRPVMQPSIELVSGEEGKDIEFRMTLEIRPEIPSVDLASIALTRSVAEVPATEVEETLNRFARSLQEPAAVTDGRAARKGDVLLMDFEGTVDGKAWPGMKADDATLELGSSQFIPGFEDQLEGVKAGEKKTVNVTFPAEYHAAELAGKEAVFEVAVKEIREVPTPVLDDALAKQAGLDTLEALRTRIAEDIRKRYDKASGEVIKRQLMDALAEKVKFDVPASLLDVEFAAIWKEVKKARASGELDKEEAAKSDAELEKDYRAIAERRLRLGLFMADVAERNKIDVSREEIGRALSVEARRFPGQEQAVVNYYTKTEGALERLRAPILEQKIVDHLLTKVAVTEKKVSVEDLMKMPELID